jgi:hypothetical protein
MLKIAIEEAFLITVPTISLSWGLWTNHPWITVQGQETMPQSVGGQETITMEGMPHNPGD